MTGAQCTLHYIVLMQQQTPLLHLLCCFEARVLCKTHGCLPVWSFLSVLGCLVRVAWG
jgi:hypothetical protein